MDLPVSTSSVLMSQACTIVPGFLWGFWRSQFSLLLRQALFHLPNQPLLLLDKLDDVIKWWHLPFINLCLLPTPNFHQLYALRIQKGQKPSLILETLKSIVGNSNHRHEKDWNSMDAECWKPQAQYKPGPELGLHGSYCRTWSLGNLEGLLKEDLKRKIH